MNYHTKKKVVIASVSTSLCLVMLFRRKIMSGIASLASPAAAATRDASQTPGADSERLKKLREQLQKEKPFLNEVVEDPNELEKELSPEIEEAHRVAFENKDAMYTDPTSGLMVFTRQAHLDRRRCCGNRCRHCPYNHVNVPLSKKGGGARSATASSNGASASKVYTRTGDKGESSLFNGARVAKSDDVFEALGSVDELNSHIGLAIAHMRHRLDDMTTLDQVARKKVLEVIALLDETQGRLLTVGSIIATPPREGKKGPTGNKTIDESQPSKWVRELEQGIDAMDEVLPTLTEFIRPGGTVAAGQLHVARSTCRRAERAVCVLRGAPQGPKFEDAAKFVNRLSDYLFTAARLCGENSL